MVSATAPPNHQFLKVSFDNDQGPLGKGLLLLTLTGVQFWFPARGHTGASL